MSKRAELIERIKLTRQAIDDLIGNRIQSYSIAGRSFTYQDVGKLEELCRSWEMQLAAKSGTRRRYKTMKVDRAFS